MVTGANQHEISVGNMKSGHKTAAVGISVLVPAHNEAGSLPGLIDEIGAALDGESFECVIIDDGSDDTTRATVREMMSRDWLRLIVHEVNCGKSAALRTGLLAASGDIIVMIDADGENDPAEIPQLVSILRAGPASLGMVNGRRNNRKHSPVKLLASRMANGIRRWVLSDNTRDSGCGFKIIRAAVFHRLPYFANWHRFFPALVQQEGFEVIESPVSDRARMAGASHYGILDRAFAGLIDLPAVYWLKRRSFGHVRSREQTRDNND